MIYNKWDLRFLKLAYHIAEWSKDESTKVGAVAIDNDRNVRALSYNGFPRGVNDNIENRKIGPLKYDFTVHAEENLCAAAARIGVSLLGCTVYCTFAPCSSCAKSLIQSGIYRIVYPKKESEKWKESQELARIMFMEANIQMLEIIL